LDDEADATMTTDERHDDTSRLRAIDEVIAAYKAEA
jgi:hypothetical protein